MSKTTKYRFRVLLNPYNNCLSCVYLDKTGMLTLTSPYSDVIEISDLEKEKDFIRNLYASIIACRLIVDGDLPPFKKLDNDSIKRIENMQNVNYTFYEIEEQNIKKIYSRFVESLKQNKEGA